MCVELSSFSLWGIRHSANQPTSLSLSPVYCRSLSSSPILSLHHTESEFLACVRMLEERDLFESGCFSSPTTSVLCGAAVATGGREGVR